MHATTFEEALAARDRAFEVIHPLVPDAAVGVTRIKDGFGVCVNLLAPTDAKIPRDIDGIPLKVTVVGLPKAAAS